MPLDNKKTGRALQKMFRTDELDFAMRGTLIRPIFDGVFDLADGTSKAAFATHDDILRVRLIKLVVGGRVDGDDMLVGQR